jgi:hypothetical protein
MRPRDIPWPVNRANSLPVVFWTYVQYSPRVADMRNKDARVLGALLRLARRRQPPLDDELLARVPGTLGEIRASLRRLRRVELVQTSKRGCPQLTLAGLAVAIAMLPARANQHSRDAGVSRAA